VIKSAKVSSYMKIKTALLIFLLIILFLFLGYDNKHHWDENNHMYKAAYASFKPPFEWFGKPGDLFYYWYANKIVHLYSAHLIVNLFGVGVGGLFLLDLTFSSFMIIYFFGAYLVLKNIFSNKTKSFLIAIILAFLPVNLYLAHKVLSEVNALVFIIYSILCFQLSLKTNVTYRGYLFIVIASILTFLGTICRLDSPVLGFSYAFTFMLFYRESSKKALKTLIIWVALYFFIILIYVKITGINPFQFILIGGPLKYGDPETTGGMIKKLLLAGSLFNIFILISFFNFKSRNFKFAIVWLLLLIMPLFIFNKRMEVRYLYLTGIPVAILSYLGIKIIYEMLEKKIPRIKVGYVFIILMTSAVLCNLLVFPYFDVGVHGNELDKVVKRISEDFDRPLIIVKAGTNVFAYLRFCYPMMLIAGDGNLGLPGEIEVNNINDLEEWSNKSIVYIEPGRRRSDIFIAKLYNKLFRKPDQLETDRPLRWIFHTQGIKSQELFSEYIYTCYKISPSPQS